MSLRVPHIISVFHFIFLIYSQSISAQEKKNRWQTSTEIIKEGILSVPSDFKMMGSEISKDWKVTALHLAGTAALVATDYHTTRYFQKYIEHKLDFELPAIEVKGDNIDWYTGENAYLTYPITGIYIGSIITNNPKGQRAFVNSFKAFSYSFLISHLFLKSVFARNRPNRIVGNPNINIPSTTNNPYDFGNFHPIYFTSRTDGTAFPSFHTTAYFALAKVMQMEFDNYLIPYGIMSLAYLENFKKHNHWISDMVLGGILGTLIGKSVVLNSRKRAASKTLSKNNIQTRLMPIIGGEINGLRLSAHF